MYVGDPAFLKVGADGNIEWVPPDQRTPKVPQVATTGRQGAMQAGMDAVNQFNQVVTAMKRAGASDRIAHYVGFQTAHETNGYTSNVLKQNGNYSGIKWVNNPAQPATQGTRSPEGNYYAKYATVNDWAKDMYRLISTGAREVDAVSLPDYVARLKADRYFGAPESQYLAALQRWEKTYGGYKVAEAAVKNPEVKPAEKKESDSILEWVSDNPLKTLGLALAVVLIARR